MLRIILGNIPQIWILSHVSCIKTLPTANTDISFFQTIKKFNNYALHLGLKIKSSCPSELEGQVYFSRCRWPTGHMQSFDSCQLIANTKIENITESKFLVPLENSGAQTQVYNSLELQLARWSCNHPLEGPKFSWPRPLQVSCSSVSPSQCLWMWVWELCLPANSKSFQYVLSSEGNQPSEFARMEGVPRTRAFHVKTGRVPGSPGWVGHPIRAGGSQIYILGISPDILFLISNYHGEYFPWKSHFCLKTHFPLFIGTFCKFFLN